MVKMRNSLREKLNNRLVEQINDPNGKHNAIVTTASKNDYSVHVYNSYKDILLVAYQLKRYDSNRWEHIGVGTIPKNLITNKHKKFPCYEVEV